MADEPEAQGLGERIKLWRKRRGLGQRELARKARVDHALINRLENGVQASVSVWTLRRIARALGVSLDYLVNTFNGEQDDPRESPEMVSTVAGIAPSPVTAL
jgi:transcriptional regulator with XRE-family HTH domain